MKELLTSGATWLKISVRIKESIKMILFSDEFIVVNIIALPYAFSKNQEIPNNFKIHPKLKPFSDSVLRFLMKLKKIYNRFHKLKKDFDEFGSILCTD